MSNRPEIKLNRKKPEAEASAPEPPGQVRRAPLMRFLLKVDRQTKYSYPTFELAEEAGRAIKQGHPVVQVAVYDSLEGTNTTIDLPKG